jgi:metal-dependent HD superfamily phosphatase/phosphodiesterase
MSNKTFNLPLNGNNKLQQLVAILESDQEIKTLLDMSNVIAINRLGYNDHGVTHVKIIANSALLMLRILREQGIGSSLKKDYGAVGFTDEDAEIVTVLGAYLHDIGHAVHRTGHELLSTVFAQPIIERLLGEIYTGEQKTIMLFETLHVVYGHEPNVLPLTIEAGIAKIADALDMEKGRARAPYADGSINIHSLSALGIENVEIDKGVGRPIKIKIHMSNTAGIFQADDLLREKLKTSGVDKYFEIEIYLIKDGKEDLLKSYVLG